MGLISSLVWNAHGGIPDKLADRAIMDMLSNVDIVVLTETWLNESTAEHTTMPGYVAHHCCGVRRGTRKSRTPGGVSVFIRNNLSSRVTREHMTNSPCCTIWLNMDKTLVDGAAEDVLLVAGYLPPAGSTAYGGHPPPEPFHILEDELEVRARGRSIMLMGDLNARVGTLEDTAPLDLFEGLEHLNLPTIELSQGFPTRSNMDKVVNPFGRDLINMCITRDMIIANGRTMGDADGYCTYYADNMLGRSSVDLCVVSTTLYPSIGRLMVLPKWECSDHLPVKIGWFASGWLDTQPNRNSGRLNNTNTGQQLNNNNNKIRYDEGQNERYKKAVRRGSVALELTTCINKLADGRYGIGEALNKISNIIKLCMKRAFGNKQVDTAKTSWWNAECETAKLKFRQAHRRDTVNINAVGALRLSAETVELRKIYRKVKNKARRCHDMKNAELLTSDFFHDPRLFWRDFKGKPDICPISDTNRWTTYFKGLVGTPDADSTDSIPHDIRVIRANTLFDGIHGATNADWIVPGYTPGLIWRASDTVKQRISNAGTLNRPINIEEVVTTIEKTNRHAAPGENQSITVSIVI